MTPDTAPLSAALLTCSYRGDFELCRLLCASVDRFVAPGMTHLLYVPARDMALFASLAAPHRHIATQDSLLPRGFWRMPMPPRSVRRRFSLLRRDVYLTPYSLPVRGWIAQQIMKLAAAAAAEHEIIVHIDSDSAFIRPLRLDQLVQDGRVRLYRSAETVDLDSHRLWHAAACRLTGLPPMQTDVRDYIDQVVVWRRSVVQALTRHLSAEAGTDWRIALARTPHFSEYILYGVFAEKVLGLDAAGQFADPQSMALCRWSGALETAASEAAFLAGLRPEHVTLMVQSTIPLTPARRSALLDEAMRHAAAQDTAPSA